MLLFKLYFIFVRFTFFSLFLLIFTVFIILFILLCVITYLIICLLNVRALWIIFYHHDFILLRVILRLNIMFCFLYIFIKPIIIYVFLFSFFIILNAILLFWFNMSILSLSLIYVSIIELCCFFRSFIIIIGIHHYHSIFSHHVWLLLDLFWTILIKFFFKKRRI